MICGTLIIDKHVTFMDTSIEFYLEFTRVKRDVHYYFTVVTP